MKNSTNNTIKTYLVKREDFTHSIGISDTRFIVSYVGKGLISGIIRVGDNYLCAVDIWHNSEFVELVTRDCCENEIAIIEKLFKGGWAE